LISFRSTIFNSDVVFNTVTKMRCSILIYALLFARPSIAGYVLDDDYNPASFLSMFNAYTGTDPTSGFGNSSNEYRGHG
jgi:hypothetical protein